MTAIENFKENSIAQKLLFIFFIVMPLSACFSFLSSSVAESSKILYFIIPFSFVNLSTFYLLSFDLVDDSFGRFLFFGKELLQKIRQNRRKMAIGLLIFSVFSFGQPLLSGQYDSLAFDQWLNATVGLVGVFLFVFPATKKILLQEEEQTLLKETRRVRNPLIIWRKFTYFFYLLSVLGALVSLFTLNSDKSNSHVVGWLVFILLFCGIFLFLHMSSKKLEKTKSFIWAIVTSIFHFFTSFIAFLFMASFTKKSGGFSSDLISGIGVLFSFIVIFGGFIPIFRAISFSEPDQAIPESH